MTEQNETQEEIMEIDAEQLQGLMEGSDKLPPIEIEMEDYKQDEFQRGIDDMSYLSGQIVALMNTGMSEQNVLDYLLNRESIKHNIEVAIINKNMNVEMSKNQRLQVEKNEL